MERVIKVSLMLLHLHQLIKSMSIFLPSHVSGSKSSFSLFPWNTNIVNLWLRNKKEKKIFSR